MRHAQPAIGRVGDFGRHLAHRVEKDVGHVSLGCLDAVAGIDRASAQVLRRVRIANRRARARHVADRYA